MPFDDYTVQDKICKGYFGEELRLQESGIGGKAKIGKMILFPDETQAKRATESLKRDLQYCKLRHRNILKIKEIFVVYEKNNYYMCTIWSFIENGKVELLNDFVLNRKADLIDDERRALMVQLTEGVAFLHTHGVSHNALTPYSALVHRAESGEAVIKITDYGLEQVSGRPFNGNYHPDGGRVKSLTYFLPPEAFGRSWDRCCKNYTNTAADVYMLGLLFVAISEHSILRPKPSTIHEDECNLSSETDSTPIVAPFLHYPGYGPVPLGKFLHGNPSVDVDQQLYRQTSPALRSLVRRMLVMVPGKRPPASGVLQILCGIKNVSRIKRAASDMDFSVISAGSISSLNTSTRSVRVGKRSRASFRFDPMGTPPKKRSIKKRLPSVMEPAPVARAAGNLVRRASIRVKATSNYLKGKENKTNL